MSLTGKTNCRYTDGNVTAAAIANLRDVEYGAIPQGQSGLALRWLIETGLVEKFTKGYSVKRGVALLDDFERKWDQLARR